MINFLLPEAALEMPGLREKTLRDEERRQVESISSKLWAEVRHLGGAAVSVAGGKVWLDRLALF